MDKKGAHTCSNEDSKVEKEAETKKLELKHLGKLEQSEFVAHALGSTSS